MSHNLWDEEMAEKNDANIPLHHTGLCNTQPPPTHRINERPVAHLEGTGDVSDT